MHIINDRKGSVAILCAVLASLILIATGIAIDYGRAKSAETRLNAAADSAALLAVSRNMMTTQINSSTIEQTAIEVFMQETADFRQKNSIVNLTPTAKLTQTSDGKWDFSLSYTAQSENYFFQILGGENSKYISIGGYSQTHNEGAPNIDFYFLLDTSMSMAFPTTLDGFSKVSGWNQKNGYGNCTFACHYNNPSATDTYKLAKSNNIPLRIDEEVKALAQAAAAAKSASAKNRATYRFAVYQFNAAETWDDASMQDLQTAWTQDQKLDNTLVKKRKDWITQQQRALVSSLDANLDNVIAKANTIQIASYYSDNCPVESTCYNPFSDYHTSSNNAFIKMNKIIPTSGKGLQGDKSQNILFVVTDGMRDEQGANDDTGAWVDGARDGNQNLSGNRFNKKYCDNIKAKGNKIAILYTEYLVESIQDDPWSVAHAKDYLSNIEPALTDCASPGLLIKVSTGDNISDALAALFNKAIATAVIQK